MATDTTAPPRMRGSCRRRRQVLLSGHVRALLAQTNEANRWCEESTAVNQATNRSVSATNGKGQRHQPARRSYNPCPYTSKLFYNPSDGSWTFQDTPVHGTAQFPSFTLNRTSR